MPTQVTPGIRRLVDEKPSRRSRGEVYKRVSHYDEYGRMIGQTHYTSHGEPRTPIRITIVAIQSVGNSLQIQTTEPKYGLEFTLLKQLGSRVKNFSQDQKTRFTKGEPIL